MLHIFRCAAGIVVLALAGVVNAQVTYHYTGNHFTDVVAPYTTSDSISGSVTLSSALGDNLTNFQPSVNSFSFTDGISTITSSSSNSTGNPDRFVFNTDAAGDIIGWLVQVYSGSTTDNLGIVTWAPGSPTEDISGRVFNNGLSSQQVGNRNNPGVWSTTAPVPEPETYAMMLAGLGLLGFVARRRKQQSA